MFLMVRNFDKLVTSNLLINKSLKIPDGFQSRPIIAATKVFVLHYYFLND